MLPEVVASNIDSFIYPTSFSGWAAGPDEPRLRSRIVLYINGEIVGEALRNLRRPDVTRFPNATVGFNVVSRRNISFEDIAENRIRLELQDDGYRGNIPVWAIVEYGKLMRAVEVLSEFSQSDQTRYMALSARLRRDFSLPPDLRQRAMAFFELCGCSPKAGTTQKLASDFEARATPSLTRVADFDGSQKLLGYFENLGENCEFGMLQRYFGFEPISLLRWASTTVQQLLEALQNEFAGVGDPEFTEFDLFWPEEYGTRDKRFGMKSHTFISEGSVTDYDREFKKQCKRLAFMKRMLLERFHEDDKIFVYSSVRGFDLNEIKALHNALRRLGATKLMCVREDNSRQGRVEVISDGLLVGYVDALARARLTPNSVSHKPWLQICKAAYNLLPKTI